MSFALLLPALPEIGLSFMGMFFLILGVFRGNQSVRMISWLTVIALVAFMAILVGLDMSHKHFLFKQYFVMDHFSYFFKILIVAAVSISLYLSLNFNEYAGMNRFEYPVLLLFATIGMMMMVSAHDMMSLYVGLELQSLSLYVIAAFMRDDVQSSEAGLKYFILGSLSSGLFLYGASLIYGFTGTTNFTDLNHFFVANEMGQGVYLGVVFVLAGLVFKISVVPFHMWTPDVYEGAPTPVTALFSMAPKIAAMGMFVRVFMEPFAEAFSETQVLLIWGSVLSMFVGSLGALRQQNIKRFLAYSSIGHVGFALLGLVAGTEEGVRNLLLYLVIYLFMNAGVFGVILSLRRDGKYITRIDELAGLSKTNPMLAFVMTVLMFSMAGIPPLAGFFAKFYVFMSVIHAELYTVAILGVLASVVAAYYYLWIIKVIYFDRPPENSTLYSDPELRPILLISIFIVVFFFLFANPVLNFAMHGAKALFVVG